MSDSLASSRERVRLFAKAADLATEVILIDHKLRRVASGVGSLVGDFEPGFYKIKLAAGGRFEEQLLELPWGERQVFFNGPPVRLQSAAPLHGEAPSAHQEGAVACSRRPQREIGSGSQIFLFARDPEGQEGGEPWRGVSILTPAGQLVLDLEEHGERSAADGFAGALVGLDPGAYVLSVDTRVWGIQQMPLVASPGWQTQVFLGARTMERKAPGSDADAPERTARRADLFTASIFMTSVGESFDPAGLSAPLVERTRLALERGRDILRAGDLRELLQGAFGDPLLGLLAGQILLLSGRPDLELLRTIVNHLRDLGLGGHPDLRALDLALEPRDDRFENPPMLRAGWRQIVKATASRPDLIPPGSPADRIARRVIGNAAWLVWRRPGPAEEKREARDVTRGSPGRRGGLGALERGLGYLSDRIEARLEPTRSLPAHYSAGPLEDDDLSVRGSDRGAGPRLDFFERNLLQLIESSVTASGGQPPDVEELVQALGLPAANIGELLEQVIRKRRF